MRDGCESGGTGCHYMENFSKFSKSVVYTYPVVMVRTTGEDAVVAGETTTTEALLGQEMEVRIYVEKGIEARLERRS